METLFSAVASVFTGTVEDETASAEESSLLSSDPSPKADPFGVLEMSDAAKLRRMSELMLQGDGQRVCGIEFVSVKDFPGYGRGLCSMLSRFPGEELFRVPAKYVLSDHNVMLKHPEMSDLWSDEESVRTLVLNPIYPFFLIFFRRWILADQSEFDSLWFSLFDTFGLLDQSTQLGYAQMPPDHSSEDTSEMESSMSKFGRMGGMAVSPLARNSFTLDWSDEELSMCGRLCPVKRMTIEVRIEIKRAFSKLRPLVEKHSALFGGTRGLTAFDERMMTFLMLTCRSRGCRLPMGTKLMSVDADGQLYEASLPGSSSSSSKSECPVHSTDQDSSSLKTKKKTKSLKKSSKNKSGRKGSKKKGMITDDDESKSKEETKDDVSIVDKFLSTLQEKERLYHCFVPFGDLGNHKFDAKCEVQWKEYQQKFSKGMHIGKDDECFKSYLKNNDDELSKMPFFEYEAADDTVVVRAQEKISSGEQVCYEYTKAPNFELLCNFGFSVSDNPYDRIIVTVLFEADSSNEEELTRLKNELHSLKLMGYAPFIRQVPSAVLPNGQPSMKQTFTVAIAITERDPIPTALLAANRIKLISEERLKTMTARDVVLLHRYIDKLKSEEKLVMIDDEKDETEEEKQTKEKKTVTKKKTAVEMENDLRFVDELKHIELELLETLLGSMHHLFVSYQNESPVMVDSKEEGKETSVDDNDDDGSDALKIETEKKKKKKQMAGQVRFTAEMMRHPGVLECYQSIRRIITASHAKLSELIQALDMPEAKPILPLGSSSGIAPSAPLTQPVSPS